MSRVEDLEVKIRQAVDSDDDAWRGRWFGDITRVAHNTNDAAFTLSLMECVFPLQKDAAAYFGVGESTYAGWKKSGFPDHARHGALAAHFVAKHWTALEEAKRDAVRPKVVRDGDAYMVVRFETDAVGVSIGKVLARDIPTEKAALVFAGGVRAWELLAEYMETVSDVYFATLADDDDAPERLVALRKVIERERRLTWAHERALASEERLREETDRIFGKTEVEL